MLLPHSPPYRLLQHLQLSLGPLAEAAATWFAVRLRVLRLKSDMADTSEQKVRVPPRVFPPASSQDRVTREQDSARRGLNRHQLTVTRVRALAQPSPISHAELGHASVRFVRDCVPALAAAREARLRDSSDECEVCP
jgi:hypothetical protein